MDSQAQIVRITIDQLAKLVKQLSGTTENRLKGITPKPPSSLTLGGGGKGDLVPDNRRRWAIVITAIAGAPSICFGSDALTNANGISLGSTTNPNVFTYELLGSAILRKIQMAASGVTSTVTFQEFEAADVLDGVE